ncbi:helix-turn-helix domain-containing protein [Oceanihabitans sp. 2_MG-2023]|uniref:helix-turn-helix domain-containing protein n=1 Tax=Oceanihabitans sp. 2_MG-2023 TaxID=3062661 RepID=UPI0026E1880F|nr:helix-turn-helix domain-containing protein [Oceanihabitans sp. 2_MG-2023]MDO6597379.1 helix-turn-helix domain-containing protein [Oceanihabitans sp. 2_MG-2023]|tara:strand:+ start:70487 stop:70783 length:297 start_codon:yes stop_codon:yes gene_type:complete
MTEIIDLLLTLSQDVKHLKARIELLRQSRAEVLKDTWIDNQDVLQTLHISKRTLQTLRTNGTLPYSKVKGKFYYKVADIEQLLQDNYYNHNFKQDGNK